MPITSALSITNALQSAVSLLTPLSDQPSLEAEVLLCEVMKVSRSHLHAWRERLLTAVEQDHFMQLLHRLRQGEPLAYLLGRREFWSLDLLVTSDTLIPRQETELLVECVLNKMTERTCKIVDLGTGSGAIALALAKERPHWEVHASDSQPAALAVAKLNAERHGLKNVIFHEGSWYEPLAGLIFDAIISNPPYIAIGDPALKQAVIDSEPHSALFSEDNGLRDITHIVREAKNHLKSNGYLFLEHGYQQAVPVKNLMLGADYIEVVTKSDLGGQERVTLGQKGAK